MRKLYHYSLCAFCRLVRVYLREKNLDHELIIDLPWKRKNVFSEYHVLSDLPTLVDLDGVVLEGWYAIVEHLEQAYRANSLLGVTQKERAESRRIVTLFNEMFFTDVTKNIVFEKVMKKHVENTSPDSASIRRGHDGVKKYFDYISGLMDYRNWLAGDDFSLADIAAASQISCVDYMGAIKWDDYPGVKDWYVRIKSRPSFRDILQDRIANVIPPDSYQELDF
ncbi:MAG: glutathione S-transferase family protein [Holosporaceae bacterium]|jgi:glutathione S-transferase|nr:glutathione S-transferase family protein [Holosporaceae bacterium]